MCFLFFIANVPFCPLYSLNLLGINTFYGWQMGRKWD